MKTIKIARNSGFCFGVKRAIKIAQKAAKKFDKLVTLGPIIHNPQMVEKLKKEGIDFVNNAAEIKDEATIIRSHGVPKGVLATLNLKAIPVINATCPYVSKTQNFGKKLSQQNYTVFILGDKIHPEVIALKSYIEGETIIVSSPADIPDRNFQKIALISQTTKNIEDFKNIMTKLVNKTEELRIINTICDATTIRQKSTLKLARESDLMIVIGGKSSSNTKMLAKISKKFIETHHIEIADEISKKWFHNKNKIGLTAGASTPDWIIIKVYNKIVDHLGNHLDYIRKVEDIPGYKEEE